MRPESVNEHAGSTVSAGRRIPIPTWRLMNGEGGRKARANSVASLVASGKMSAAEAVVPILAGLSTNTISKMVLARTSGGGAFPVRVIPGLLVVALAAWAGALNIQVSGYCNWE